MYRSINLILAMSLLGATGAACFAGDQPKKTTAPPKTSVAPKPAATQPKPKARKPTPCKPRPGVPRYITCPGQG